MEGRCVRKRGTDKDRLRTSIFQRYKCTYKYWRRQCHGRQSGTSAAGHGVRTVPSFWNIRRWCMQKTKVGEFMELIPWAGSHHRRRSWRGRLPFERRGRTFHGTLRPNSKRPSITRCSQSVNEPRNTGGSRLRTKQRSHTPSVVPPPERRYHGKTTRNCRDSSNLCGDRYHAGTYSCAANGTLLYGRYSN